MKTPITDAAWQDWIATGSASQSLARPMSYLEADRAALMGALAEALEDMVDDKSRLRKPRWTAYRKARAALSAARANFPTTP